MATQGAFDFGDTEEANSKADADKARQKARDFYTSDPEYAKKMQEREEAKKQDERMREIVKEKAAKKAALAQSSMISPKGNTTAAGRGGVGGGAGGAGEIKALTNPRAMRKGGKVKKYEGGGSIRVDRSPKYSDAEMASVRKQLNDQEKAAKPEHDKNVERYNKAMDEVTKRTQPGMARMNPAGDTYKKGGKVSSASKRADGCAIRGKTRA